MLALLRASLALMHFDLFSACLSSMGSLCLSMCPKKSWLGDCPSSLAILRQAAIAVYKTEDLKQEAFAKYPSHAPDINVRDYFMLPIWPSTQLNLSDS